MSDLPTIQLECKKDGLQQLQNGTWKFTLTVNGEDMGKALPVLGPAPMGTRYQVVMVEIGDDEQPVNREPQPGDEVKSVAGYAKPPMTEAQRCGMLCQDERFQNWLRKYARADAELEPADIIRALLGVESRAQIDSNHATRETWRHIVQRYESDTGLTAAQR